MCSIKTSHLTATIKFNIWKSGVAFQLKNSLKCNLEMQNPSSGYDQGECGSCIRSNKVHPINLEILRILTQLMFSLQKHKKQKCWNIVFFPWHDEYIIFTQPLSFIWLGHSLHNYENVKQAKCDLKQPSEILPLNIFYLHILRPFWLEISNMYEWIAVFKQF